jgi:hypothetical protein
LVILGMGNPHRLTPRELLHAWRVRHDDPDMVVVYKRPGGGLIDSSDPKSLPLAV